MNKYRQYMQHILCSTHNDKAGFQLFQGQYSLLHRKVRLFRCSQGIRVFGWSGSLNIEKKKQPTTYKEILKLISVYKKIRILDFSYSTKYLFIIFQKLQVQLDPDPQHCSEYSTLHSPQSRVPIIDWQLTGAYTPTVPPQNNYSKKGKGLEATLLPSKGT